MCMSLWRDGQMVLVTTFEKLSYFGGEAHPSGTSSLSSLAKTIIDSTGSSTSAGRAIRALVPQGFGRLQRGPQGESRRHPCITEINAGRFFIGMTAFDEVSTHRVASVFVRLACNEIVDDVLTEYATVPDYYVVRDLDTLPGVFSADDLFSGITRWHGDSPAMTEGRAI